MSRSPTSGRQGQGPDVLVIEDDRPTRALMGAILRDESLTFHLTASGHEAMDYVLDNPPSIVVLDLHLPGVQGEAIATALRIQCGQTLPILAMSASNEQAAAYRLGAYGYVQKPFEIDDLVLLVRQGLDLARHSRELRERVREARERVRRTMEQQREAFNSAVIEPAGGGQPRAAAQ